MPKYSKVLKIGLPKLNIFRQDFDMVTWIDKVTWIIDFENVLYIMCLLETCFMPRHKNLWSKKSRKELNRSLERVKCRHAPLEPFIQRVSGYQNTARAEGPSWPLDFLKQKEALYSQSLASPHIPDKNVN